MSGRVQSHSNQLYIRSAQRDDAGRYACVTQIRHPDGRISTAEGFAKVNVEPCERVCCAACITTVVVYLVACSMSLSAESHEACT